VAAVREHAIEPIDMVVVNLYAFEKTAGKPGVAFAEVIENIDIGGPSMVRSAAKNFEDVAIVTAVADYGAIAEELAANSGSLGRATRWRLAKAAFATTAAYDVGIATTLESMAAPVAHGEPAVFEVEAMAPVLRVIEKRQAVLRYGENPHQKAALYVDGSGRGVAAAKQLQGKELSYNNIVDLDACWGLVSEFDAQEAAVAIIKHTNPCGAATGASVAEAYRRALEADPVSAFGGVIGINREVDAEAAEEIAKLFVEAIVAPRFTAEAAARFAAKKNLRLLEIAASEAGVGIPDAGCGPPARCRGRPAGGDQARAVGGGDALAAVRVERVQAREVQRDCVRALRRGPWADRGHWRGADEPGGCGPLWRDEGGAAAGRDGSRFGRLLSVSGWPGNGGGGRRDGGDPARGVGAGCRGDCGGRPAGPGHGVYRDPPFPAWVTPRTAVAPAGQAVNLRNLPSGAKARNHFAWFMYGLKPAPFKTDLN
jgi:hypothetical protein